MIRCLIFSLIGFFASPIAYSQCFHYSKMEQKVSKNCHLPRYWDLQAKNVKSGTKIIFLNGRDTIGRDSFVRIKLDSFKSYSIKVISSDSFCSDTQYFSYSPISPKHSRVYDQNNKLTRTPEFHICINGNKPDTFTLNLILDSFVLNWRADFGDGTKIYSGDTLRKISHLYKNLGIYYPKIYYGNSDCIDTILGKFSLERDPVAGISFSSSLGSNQGCVPLTVKFRNSTRYKTPGTVFEWDMGDGTKFTSSADTITHTYTKNLCNGVVKLTATNKCGSSVATWNPIQASEPDEPIIAVINPLNCDTSKPYIFLPRWKDKYCLIPDIKYFKWIWGDGTSTQWTTSLDSVKKKFDYGTYEIRFLVRNGCGIDTSEYILSVIDKPQSSIQKVYRDTGCSPYTINFKTPSKSGENYSWSFGDGNGASGSSVNYTYRSPGKYVVRLNTTNRCGNSQSYDTIVIYNKTKPQISPQNMVDCWPVDVEIKNTTNSGGSKDLRWLWYINDSLLSTSRDIHKLKGLSPGKYKIKLLTEDYCGKDSTVSNVEILPVPVADFDTPTIGKCVQDGSRFRNFSKNTDSSIWITSEGTYRYGGTSDLQITFKTKGPHKVTLIAKSSRGCSDTTSRTIWVRPEIKAYFYHDNKGGCGPVRINFTSKSESVDSFLWVFGDTPVKGKDTISWFFSGKKLFDTTYTVKLIGWSPGCRKDSFETQILLRGGPIASFVSDRDTFCFPEKVTFFNQSLKAIRFQWDMGQGLRLNIPNPQVYFPKNPNYLRDTTYRVILTAYGDVPNCISRDTGYVTVKPYPIPIIETTSSGGCSPYKATFVSSSINSKGSFWDFGNGFTALGDSVTHTFFNRGFRDTSYRIMLRVKSIDCYDSAIITIPVYLPTVANFDYNRAGTCKKEEWEFVNRSINSSEWEWDFGDGTGSNFKSPFHQFYSSPYRDTSYVVTLTSKNPKGCTDTVSRVIWVKQKLRVGFKDTSLNSCPPFKVSFANQSSGASTFIWDFGDGTGSSLKNPTHTYNSTGDYRYKLIAFDDNGCKDSAISSGIISVKERPSSLISVSSDQIKFPDSTIFFSDVSLRSLRSEWDFGDGQTSKNRNISKTFEDSGTYTVRLISSNLGCSDTSYKTIRVDWWNPIIDVEYRKDTQCAPAVYEFKNNTKYAEKWTWYFGDGSPASSQKNPIHVYKFGGNYKAILVAEGQGGKSTSYFLIKVLKSPTSSFEFSPKEYERLYYNWRGTPTNLSLWNVYNRWTVIDTKKDTIYFNSELYEPLIKLPKPGTFIVVLVTTSEDGCSDTSEINIELEKIPTIYVPNAFTPNKDRNNENFGIYLSNERVQITDFDFQIYNRWGEKVFHSFNINNRWDGTFGGKICQDGVYAWKLRINLEGTVISQSGTVSLLR